MNNPKYDYYKALHPEWSDEQIWTAVSIDMQSIIDIDKRGKDINLEDQDLMKDILEGARNWLACVLPDIFAKVSAFFERLIATIGEWIQKGLTFVLDAIARLLGK